MKKILLIEDNPDIRENMVEILELANYKVLTAKDGKVGAALAIAELPNLIVCDIMMPVLDGYGTLHLLQKHESTNKIPFIFLTAKAEHSEIRKGMDLGADDYITKPFSATELLNAIEVRLKKAKTNQEFSESSHNNNAPTQSATETISTFVNGRFANKYKKGQEIYSVGNHPSKLFYIIDGKVKAYKVNEDGKEFVIGLYNSGEFMGYTALFEETVYKETTTALDACEIAVIPKNEFVDLISTNPEVLHQFVHLLANNVTDLEQQLLGLAYNSLRKKVAETLLTLKKKYTLKNEDNFTINISRENLANMAGTAKESLIRTLSDFKDEKLIDIVKGDIQIINEKRLSDMFN